MNVSVAMPVEAALGYAEQGMRVIPLRPSGETKLPQHKGWQDIATTDADTIRQWWSATPTAGVGIATGAGLIVLDVDNKNRHCGDAALAALIAEHGDWPTTRMASTQNAGFHYYLRAPIEIRNSAGKLGDGLDIRGHNGYVVAPSPAACGSGYQWRNDEDVADAPAWLVALALQANSQTKTTRAPAGSIVPNGSRNTTLFKAGAALRAQGATQTEIAAHLRSVPIEGTMKPGEIDQIAASATRYQPNAWGNVADPCTHLANANRLVAHYGDKLMFVEGIGWHTWGPPWQHDDLAAHRIVHGLGMIIAQEAAALAPWVAQAPDPDTRKKREAVMSARFKWAATSEAIYTIDSSLRVAESLFACKAAELDADPMLLGTPTGVLELDTGLHREHRHADRLTKVTGCEFDPTATAPTWERFVHEAMGGDSELVDYLQRLMGYTLAGMRGEHLLPILWGSGANGKSTFLGALQATLGAYASGAAPGLLIQRGGNDHPTGLADLQGRRLVICSETGEAGRLNEEQAKALTGGDTITARRMRMDFYTFEATHQLFLQTNHRPRVTGTDEGVWRRLRLIPFAVTVPKDKRDPRLPDRLRTELPGILAWAWRGWQRYQSEGFNDPAAVRAATAEYRESSDAIGAFLNETCTVGSHVTAGSGALYRSYVEWCDEAGERPRPQREFGMRLSERGFEQTRGSGGARRWRGLALIECSAVAIPKWAAR